MEYGDRCEHLHLGGQAGQAHLEPDLVVALAGAAVGDHVGAPLPGHPGQVLHDQRPGQRRDQRVAVHVEGIRLDRGQAVAGGELLPRIHHLGVGSAAGQGPLADGVQVLAALADVHRDRDDLGPGFLGDPADGDRGVQAARVSKYHALGHVTFLVGVVSASV